jgi:hypothetical protein
MSIVLAPVDFHYDQIPLLLAVVVAVAVGRRLWAIALTWVVAGVVPWFVFFVELGVGGPDSQSLSGIVPILIALLLAAVAWSARAAD